MYLVWCDDLKGLNVKIFCLANFDLQKFYFWKIKVVNCYGQTKAIFLRENSRLVVLLDIHGLKDLRAIIINELDVTLNGKQRSHAEN